MAEQDEINSRDLLLKKLSSRYPMRLAMDGFYFDVCEENTSKFVDLDLALQQHKREFPEEGGTEFALEQQRDKSGIVAVVFAALWMEAAINDYAASNLGFSFAEKYIDKLDVIAKWVVVPKLVTGKEVPRDGEAFRFLRELVRERNRLVHFKSSPVPREQEEMKRAAEREARFPQLVRNSYRGIYLLAHEIHEMDRVLEHFWYLDASCREIPPNLIDLRRTTLGA